MADALHPPDEDQDPIIFPVFRSKAITISDHDKELPRGVIFKLSNQQYSLTVDTVPVVPEEYPKPTDIVGEKHYALGLRVKAVKDQLYIADQIGTYRLILQSREELNKVYDWVLRGTRSGSIDAPLPLYVEELDDPEKMQKIQEETAEDLAANDEASVSSQNSDKVTDKGEEVLEGTGEEVGLITLRYLKKPRGPSSTKNFTKRRNRKSEGAIPKDDGKSEKGDDEDTETDEEARIRNQNQSVIQSQDNGINDSRVQMIERQMIRITRKKQQDGIVKTVPETEQSLAEILTSMKIQEYRLKKLERSSERIDVSRLEKYANDTSVNLEAMEIFMDKIDKRVERVSRGKISFSTAAASTMVTPSLAQELKDAKKKARANVARREREEEQDSDLSEDEQQQTVIEVPKKKGKPSILPLESTRMSVSLNRREQPLPLRNRTSDHASGMLQLYGYTLPRRADSSRVEDQRNRVDQTRRESTRTRTEKNRTRPNLRTITALSAVQGMLKKLRRRARRSGTDTLNDTIKAMRLDLRNMIKEAKKKSWREFVTLNTPWGKPYKFVVKSSKKIPQLVSDEVLLAEKEEEEEIGITTTDLQPPEDDNYIVTEDKVTKTLKSVRNRSAPGIDLINYKSLKLFNRRFPKFLAKLKGTEDAVHNLLQDIECCRMHFRRVAVIAIDIKEGGLELSLPKTEVMVINGNTKRHSRAKCLEFSFRGQQMDTVESFKYLGIVLHANLNWDPHLKYITEKPKTLSTK
ncbi:hypothetical protein ACFE04_008643 [Oxalis oulophora]